MSAQALAAASKTVDCFKLVHTLHATFIISGDDTVPILYQVERVRDGNSFATRRVEAKQKGSVIFSLIASFQKEEIGFDHQVVSMPPVPSPDSLASMEELRERSLTDSRLPPHYRNRVAREMFVPWPIEIRARGNLSDDATLYRMWFHRPVKADEWLLYAIESPTAFGVMGYVFLACTT
ncbi:hypothetical protein LUZ60_016774 [Juncus effusus]|nr:hypothetical protein LUZ60_016774 [Juncus effusus]